MMRFLIPLRCSLGAALVISFMAPAAVLAATSTYTYDNLNRMTSATIDGSRIEYVYDAAGNITQVLTPYSIAVTKSGAGTGVVVDNAAKINCGADCSGVYDSGNAVTLTASPNPGMIFSGWAGECTGIGACFVTVDGAKGVQAAFGQLSADLSITKTDDLETAAPGQTITYTIVVNSAGPDEVTDAQVADSLPGDLTCTWTSVAAGGATGSAGTGTGDLSETLTLPAGASMTYSATCEIALDAEGILSNTATIASAAADSNAGNESATDTTNLVASADLWLDLTADPVATGPGANVTYTVLVGNNGPTTATNLTVEDVLPAGTTLGTITAPDWSCSETAGTLSCTLVSLAPSTQSQIVFDLGLGSTPGSVANSASVSSTTPEGAPGDETDSIDVEVFGAPTIVGAHSVSSTEAGSLTDGTITSSSFTQIYLEASHELSDPGGNSDPNDVTNPDCYRIFQAAPDGTFSSTSCADPHDVPILGVTYGEAGTATIALRLSNGQALAAGLYRLLVCGEGTEYIQDAFGSALDGNDNGIGGDTFELDFEVEVSNLLTNPNFDDVLDGWDITSENPGDVLHDATDDASAAPTSGSAYLVNLSGAGSLLELTQCVPVVEDEVYFVGGKLRAASSGQTFPEIRALVVTYGSAGCAGVPVGGVDAGAVAGDTAGVWINGWQAGLTIPTGAVSAQVTFQVTGDEYMAETWLDDLQFYFGGVAIVFVDGFETGDTSAWSATAGK